MRVWHTTRHRVALAVGIAVCAVILTACGGTPSQVRAGSGTTLASTWVDTSAAQSPSMVTWTIVHSSVTGDLDVSALSSSGTSVRSRSISFTGTISGESLTLTFEGATTLSGTVTPTRLTLDAPQSNGQINEITLVPSATSAYNAEVAALQRSAYTAEQEAQQQQDAAARAAAVAAAAHVKRLAIRDDAANVAGDLSTLQGDESQLASAVASVNKALGSEGTALAKTATYLTKTEAMVKKYGTGSGNGVCYEASQDVGYDASQDVFPDIGSVQSDIHSLQSDFHSLQSAEAAMPSYLPTYTPTSSIEQQAVAAGHTSIANAVATTNSYIGQANAEVNTAFGYVAIAYKDGNCGTPPSSPSPVSTISASSTSGS